MNSPSTRVAVKAENRQLFGVLGAASHVTVWRRLRLVVMRYAGGHRTTHRGVSGATVNALEADLLAAGWTPQLSNTCRTEWTQ